MTQGQLHLSAFSTPFKIAIGLVVGLLLGITAQAFAPAETVKWWSTNIAAPIGAVFLNMMFMVIIPLLFSSLALGVAGLGDAGSIRKLGGRILIGTVILTMSGVFIGLLFVNTLKPGTRISSEARVRLISDTQSADVEKRLSQAKAATPLAETIPTLITRNPVEDMANLFTPNPAYKGGGIIAFIAFTIITGLALTMVEREKAAPILALLEGIQSVSMVIIGFAMTLAPFGVAALIFQTSSKVGLELFGVLGLYIVAVLGALLVQLLLTYSIALKFLAKRSPWVFFRQIEEVMITAFSTSSSNATLPTSLRVAHERVGLNKAVSSFVLTVGSAANQNGTALFEGITVLFLAQFYAVDLSFQQQLTVVGMSILAGIGTAGVPGGSIPLIAILLTQVGIPAEGIGIILGVDRLLDMSRTVINVAGDLVLAAICDPGTGE
ncbi:MAG: dicarboxylate/amino acid:cation symporter [Candidatus Sumerlaeia bacterium]|nr:dicarboxylate/amino acid:cation symporter [Candidatus Sumerlaeia bacterium]